MESRHKMPALSSLEASGGLYLHPLLEMTENNHLWLWQWICLATAGVRHIRSWSQEIVTSFIRLIVYWQSCTLRNWTILSGGKGPDVTTVFLRIKTGTTCLCPSSPAAVREEKHKRFLTMFGQVSIRCPEPMKQEAHTSWPSSPACDGT